MGIKQGVHTAKQSIATVYQEWLFWQGEERPP